MTYALRTAVLAAFCLTAAPAANAVSLSLALTSDPALSGAPGSEVFWGFSLTNNSPDDLYVTSVYADGSLYGTGGSSTLGTFVDQIAHWSAGNGLVVNGGTTFTGNAPGQALASFQISPSATVGSSLVSGHIYLTYDMYDSNMNYLGSDTLAAQYGGGNATASVAVTAPSGAVPEPGTAALMLLGLAALRARKPA